ncbi:hypothetical protein D7X32_01080 [Corallococcus carmarthensis]|uniref:Uncharacterized protein n=1 Tax=Corallococcus carmarthensis TaxID=2316728 RepID=A0A3A8KJZ1_9BACT|nr:hypothetical protein D7X32_01080 [Corallococcus carmarthensis]
MGLKVVTTAKAYDELDGSSVGTERITPARCQYAGMNKTPFDGVMLALLRAGADDESWEVYEPTHHASGCTAPAVSKARLAEAKAAFAKANMPMDKEVPFTATPDAKGRMSLKLGDRTVVLQAVEKDEACDAEAQPEKVKASHCDEANDRILIVTVLADGKPVHESWGTYTASYAGHASLKVMGAFVSGTKVLLLQRFTVGSGMKGPSEASTTLSVSPVLDFAP